MLKSTTKDETRKVSKIVGKLFFICGNSIEEENSRKKRGKFNPYNEVDTLREKL